MNYKLGKYLFTGEYRHKDFPAGIAIFLVAIPLCLGIAHASGAPLLSGLIAGVIGGSSKSGTISREWPNSWVYGYYIIWNSRIR
jgi:MFS superfamily sulfate permease-like transporter